MQNLNTYCLGQRRKWLLSTSCADNSICTFPLHTQQWFWLSPFGLSLTLSWHTMQEINTNQLLNPSERVECMLRKIPKKIGRNQLKEKLWISSAETQKAGRTTVRVHPPEGWQLYWAARNHLEGQQLWITLLSPPAQPSCSHSCWAE